MPLSRSPAIEIFLFFLLLTQIYGCDVGVAKLTLLKNGYELTNKSFISAIDKNDNQAIEDFILSQELNPQTEETPLHRAVVRENQIVVEKLLKAGSHPNNPNGIVNGSEPLEVAIFHCNFPISKILIESGADINRGEKNQATPLAQAYIGVRKYKYKCAKIAELLEELGAICEDPPKYDFLDGGRLVPTTTCQHKR
jgi:ankyrin repeat protein